MVYRRLGVKKFTVPLSGLCTVMSSNNALLLEVIETPYGIEPQGVFSRNKRVQQKGHANIYEHLLWRCGRFKGG